MYYMNILHDIDREITGWPTMIRLDGQRDEATVDIQYLSTGTVEKHHISTLLSKDMEFQQ